MRASSPAVTLTPAPGSQAPGVLQDGVSSPGPVAWPGVNEIPSIRRDARVTQGSDTPRGGGAIAARPGNRQSRITHTQSSPSQERQSVVRAAVNARPTAGHGIVGLVRLALETVSRTTIKTGTIRIRPSLRAGVMNKSLWRIRTEILTEGQASAAAVRHLLEIVCGHPCPHSRPLLRSPPDRAPPQRIWCVRRSTRLLPACISCSRPQSQARCTTVRHRAQPGRRNSSHRYGAARTRTSPLATNRSIMRSPRLSPARIARVYV